MIEVVISAAAEADYADALLWYAERSVRAAEGFQSQFEYSLKSISENPERFAACDEHHRRFIMRRYPYQVVYRVHSDRVLIVAVAHAKRRPNYWLRSE